MKSGNLSLAMGERKILTIAVNGKMNKKCCGRSSVVEFQPSKLAVVGSNPIARSIFVSGWNFGG